MSTDPYFDLDTARKTLKWLKTKISEMNELSQTGVDAMEKYDMELADTVTIKIQSILEGIRKKGIVIRDQDATLFDFPAVINNIPSYLCWSIDEDELGPGEIVKLTSFGRLLYDKILELEQIFVENIEDVE